MCHATPAQRSEPLQTGSDHVAYERNVQRLHAEFSRRMPSDSVMEQLLKETFHQRRQQIEASSDSTSHLLDLHPYFTSAKWVSIILVMLVHT